MSDRAPVPDVRALTSKRFDVIVIGGGIHGCGIARDATLRGLQVALFEKDDFGSGTSGATSKLVHGGLRYLEHFRLGLVRESLREREILLHTAPHLVRPLPFLVPIYEDAPRGPWKVAAGLTLYDLLAFGHALSRHRHLSRERCLRLEPRLRAEGLRAAFLYHDAQMNDARLVLENAIEARSQGGEIWNRTRVEGLLQEQSRIKGVQVRDLRSGQLFDVEGGLVINAAGPWYGTIRAQQQLIRNGHVRLSRGSHIVVPSVLHGHALLLSARTDGRVFFVLPWKGNSLVGTTDIEHDGDLDHPEATEEEIEYLLRELSWVLEDAPTRDDVLATFAGVRALAPSDEPDVGDISRAAHVRLDAPGFLGVLGGKYTTYRAVSERVVDQTLRILERARPLPCTTATRHLPGGDIPDMTDYFTIAETVLLAKYPLERDILRYLLGTYGTRHTGILKLIDEDPTRARRIEPGLPFTRAEVVFSVRSEMAVALDDLLWRRTYRGHLGPLSDVARRAWEDALRHALDSSR